MLKTNRLVLRQFEMTDINDFHRLYDNDLVWTYSTRERIGSLIEAKKLLGLRFLQYIKNEYAPYALFTVDGDFVGEAGVYSGTPWRINIGYNLLPEHWGRGYATEITKGLIQWYFTHSDVQRIEATTLEDHIVSRRVLEKSGMQLEGILRKFTLIDGAYKNVCYYSVLR